MEIENMVKLTFRIVTCLILFIALPGFSSIPSRASVNGDEDRYDFRMARRINAHGDEFMSLALTSDAKRLVVGTEAGKLIIWGVAERRILKQFNQGSPVHCVVALSDSDTFVAAGGPHSQEEQRGIARKWSISTGAFEELHGAGEGTVTLLANSPENGLLAAGDSMGRLSVWDSRTGQLVITRDLKQPLIGLAVIGQDLFLTSLSVEDMEQIDTDADYQPTNSIFTFSLAKPDRQLRKLTSDRTGRLWGELRPSPDGRLIAANYAEQAGLRVGLLNTATGREIAVFESRSASWSSKGHLVLFDHEVPTASVNVNVDGQVSRSDLLKSGKFHAAGAPSKMAGQVVSPDGSMAWEIFQLGATLVECDLNKKTFNELYYLRGLLYAMDVREQSELLATGGDDGFVRVWKLSNLAPVKEFRVTMGVPQGVALMADGRHVVFSSSSRESATRINLGEVVSGTSRLLLEVPEPFVRVVPAAGGFVYNHQNLLLLADPVTGATVRQFAVEAVLGHFSISENGEWIAAANDQGVVYRFEIKTGKRLTVNLEKIENLTRLAISNDGHYVYTAEFGGALIRWDTSEHVMKKLSNLRGQAHALVLSRDGRRIAVGGNHRDVAVYDATTGDRLTSVETAASDFYVTNVWLLSSRLLFTTDAGVLVDGVLER